MPDFHMTALLKISITSLLILFSGNEARGTVRSCKALFVARAADYQEFTPIAQSAYPQFAKVPLLKQKRNTSVCMPYSCVNTLNILLNGKLNRAQLLNLANAIMKDASLRNFINVYEEGMNFDLDLYPILKRLLRSEKYEGLGVKPNITLMDDFSWRECDLLMGAFGILDSERGHAVTILKIEILDDGGIYFETLDPNRPTHIHKFTLRNDPESGVDYPTFWDGQYYIFLDHFAIYFSQWR